MTKKEFIEAMKTIKDYCKLNCVNCPCCPMYDNCYTFDSHNTPKKWKVSDD